jgi:site-specific DNA-cytosine methylase
MDNSEKTILSLFDHSGAWSEPYLQAGYQVLRIDIKNFPSVNVLDLDEQFFKDLGSVYGILAAPPCTDFSTSGNQHWSEKDKDGRTKESLKLIAKVLQIITWTKPQFWAMENPVGRLNTILPGLALFGPWYFQPYWYGDPYTKKTGLWGVFNNQLEMNEVKPKVYTSETENVKKQRSWQAANLGGKSERTKELRSITPSGFANAFFKANQ